MQNKCKRFSCIFLFSDYNGVQQQIVLPINCLIFKQTGELTMHAHVYKGKNRMKPSLVDLIGAIIGFAGLAVFVFLCLAY